MQKWVVNTIFLIVDDAEGAIYVFYPMMNRTDSMQFLGKLHETCRLYKTAIKEFRKLSKSILKK